MRSGRERVLLIGFHPGKRVVNVRMAGLVSSDRKNEVKHRSILVQAPVLDRDRWWFSIRPFRNTAVFEVFGQVGVRLDSFLLEVSDHTVAERRGHEVGEEEEVAEDALGKQHGPSNKDTRLTQL